MIANHCYNGRLHASKIFTQGCFSYKAEVALNIGSNSFKDIYTKKNQQGETMDAPSLLINPKLTFTL